MHAADLIIHLIGTLEKEGVSSVYLRNYENLPFDVGNDVDLLIPRGGMHRVTEILKREAKLVGWCFLGCASFSSLAVYFANPATGETLHVDLFDRIAWHFLGYADAALILAKRRWNGLVFIPDDRDVLYINLCARLIYQGVIREKHQKQAAAWLSSEGEAFVAGAFERHLGKNGRSFAADLIRCDWAGSPALSARLRRLAWLRYGGRHPLQTLRGLLAYVWRILAKLVHPPGCFLVFEGADGVGKSTVMQSVVPWCASWCSGRAPYDFHWKPVNLQTGEREKSPGVDPRGKPLRGTAASLVYLMYHLAGFWSGWLIRIYPLLIRGHAVVGDRYSYDLFLDPRRFRLKLPSWLCKVAALAAPRPDLVIGLVAMPELVNARKPELGVEGIAAYQKRWDVLAKGRGWMLTVSADGSVEQVLQRVKCRILLGISESC